MERSTTYNNSLAVAKALIETYENFYFSVVDGQITSEQITIFLDKVGDLQKSFMKAQRDDYGAQYVKPNYDYK